jgi:hypothetical protein
MVLLFGQVLDFCTTLAADFLVLQRELPRASR